MIVRHRLPAVLLFGAMAAVAPAQSIPADSAPQDDIIVLGRSLPKAEEAVRKLTRKVSRQTGGQLARFQRPVCASAWGLPDQFAGVVARRIMAVAKSAKIPVAGAGCEPNVTVFFVPSGHAVLEGIARSRSNALSAVPAAERKRLMAETGPVRVLTVTQLRSRDGDGLSTTIKGIAAGKEHIPFLEVRSASIINLPTRQDINGVLVLIDIPATLGKSLGQLGDYAAMRALARTRDEDISAEDGTILSLFGNEGAPRSLTAFDQAYLTELYRGPATQAGIAKTSRIAARINSAREAE